MSLAQDEEAFNDVVSEAIDDLPEFLRERMDDQGVSIHVVDVPDPGVFPDLTPEERRRILGSYVGRSEAKRYEVYPDEANRVEIYREAFARQFGSDERIRQEVRLTLLHELGHFLGLDEDRLRELETAYLRRGTEGGTETTNGPG